MSSTSSSSSSSSSDSSGSSSDSSSSDTEQSAASQGSARSRKSPVKSPKPHPERRKSSGSSAPAKPTRSEAQPKTTSRKVSSTTGPTTGRGAAASSAAARAAPKSPVRRAAADSKAAKKSIFSPDESSASEPETANKATAKPAAKKPARKANGSAKNSSVSSSRAGSGADSGSSSAGEGPEGPPTAARLPADAPPKQAAAAGSSDSEAVRRRTRSTRPSRSQLKRAIYNTDSESETADSQQGTKGPRKRKRLGGPGGGPAPQRPAADQPPQQRPPTMGEGSCPVPDCDSGGHLSGLHERHFSRAACPLYHRTSDTQAKDQQLEREIRASDRQKALNKYRAGQVTPEQKTYHSRVTSQRRQTAESTERKPELLDEERSREIDLENLTPSYDLSLFREAQAAASAQTEDSLRSLPDTPGLHSIEMGRFDMEVWYQSPYPEDFPRGSKMYICQYCLKYLRCRTSLERHNAKCVWRFPPGDEIYRKDALSVFEVDGRRFKSYCQNLCLLAKLFLDNKTLYFDVEPFLFYVMTVADSEGCHVVGYFSKEKNSFLNYNVSCIMTLPPYQRQGYGRLLIDFSYLLTKTEGKIGSPEKPLSDLGLISYRSYWKDALLRYFSDFRGKVVSIKDISQEMAANSNDIVSTLQAVGIVKYWKNKHIILKRQDIFEEFEEKRRRRGPDHKEIDPKCLNWKPFQPPDQNKSS